MKNFDVDINFNGVASDLDFVNVGGEEENTTPTNKPTDEKKEKKDKQPTKKSNDLSKKIDKYTKLFKDWTGYETPADREARLIKEKEEQGKRKTIFGLHPFVAIGLSLVVIVSGTIIITKLKTK